MITASPAFARSGTLFPGISGPGGGRIGTLVISPYVQPGSVNETAYNHYSLLRSPEDLFGLDGHLGYAAMAGVPSFGADVYNRPQGGPLPDVPALPAGDAGSTGRAVPLRLRIRSAPPRRLRRARPLRHGHGHLRVRPRRHARLRPGHYRLVAQALHEGRAVATASRPVRLHR